LALLERKKRALADGVETQHGLGVRVGTRPVHVRAPARVRVRARNMSDALERTRII